MLYCLVAWPKERGFPLDRTFELYHVATSKVLAVNANTHNLIELQRPGRLLPQQRWVYDREHGLWNPASGKSLALNQADGLLVSRDLAMDHQHHASSTSWSFDPKYGQILVDLMSYDGASTRRLVGPEPGSIRRGSFDLATARRGSVDASRLGSGAFSPPNAEPKLTFAPYSAKDDTSVPEAAKWQLRGDPCGGFPSSLATDFTISHAHSFCCLGLNSFGGIVLHSADHDEFSWRWTYDRASQALCVGDQGLCIEVVEVAGSILSRAGMKLQTARPDSTRHSAQRWVYDPSTRVVLHPASLCVLDVSGPGSSKSGKAVNPKPIVSQIKNRVARSQLSGPSPQLEAIRCQEMLIDPGVPALSRAQAEEAGLLLREADVRGSNEKALGSHSGAEVRVAFHRCLKVTLKTLKNTEHRAREAWALYRLSHHPGVVQGLGFVWPEAAAVPQGLVFASVEGCSLHDYARGRGVGLLLVECVDIGVQIAMALDYMHSRGFCHGDLQCNSVLLDGCGNVKLADFTLTKCIGDYNRGRTVLDVRNLASILYRLSSANLSEPAYHPWKLVESDPLETVAHLDSVRHACLARCIMGCFGWGGAESFTALDVVMSLSDARGAIIAQEEYKSSSLAGGLPVSVGSTLRFMHMGSGRALASCRGEVSVPGQQLVYGATCEEWQEEPHDLQWVLELAGGGAGESPAAPPFLSSEHLRVCSGDHVKLRHRSSGKYLACPAGVHKSSSGWQEVAAVGAEGEDGEWRVEVVEESSIQGPGVGVGCWRGGGNLWLTNAKTGARLRSHPGRHVRSEWQQEVGAAAPGAGKQEDDELWRGDVLGGARTTA